MIRKCRPLSQSEEERRGQPLGDNNARAVSRKNCVIKSRVADPAKT